MTQFPSTSRPSSGLAIASMVLGIVSLALFCVWYVAIPCAIIGLVLGVVANGKSSRGEAGGAGMAKAGMICSIVALGLAILITILAIVGISLFGHGLAKMQQQIQQQQLQQLHPTTPTPTLPNAPTPPTPPSP